MVNFTRAAKPGKAKSRGGKWSWSMGGVIRGVLVSEKGLKGKWGNERLEGCGTQNEKRRKSEVGVRLMS